MTSTTPVGSVAGATEVVSDFVARSRSGAPNADAVGRVLVDTVTVAIAGVGTEVSSHLLDWVLAERAPGPAAVWGTDLTLAPSQAALVNGTTAHALDWDDAVPSFPLHPGAVMVPALLARLSASPAGGDRLVAAYNIGSAVAHVISELLPVESHYAKGWHNTSTTGRIAATAAVAHLTGLDAEATRRALGIVSSTAAGSLANFGSMTKPLHAGLAARDAVMAVALAERGLTAHASILETRRGFLAMYGTRDSSDVGSLAERLERWEGEWVEDWVLKRYPSCYATHRAIDAVLTLVGSGLDPAHVTSVEVSVPHTDGSPLIEHVPTTGLEGKFSLEYVVARAIVSADVTLTDFTDARVLDSQVRELMAACRLVRHPAGEPAPDGHHTSVLLRLADGRELRHGVDVTHGDARNPLTDDELTAKATGALYAVGWRPSDAAALVARLASVPRQSELGWLQGALGVVA